METPYYLNVYYPAHLYPAFDQTLRRLVGRHEAAGGMGFGERDLAFGYHVRAALTRAQKKIMALKIKGLTTDIYEPDSPVES